MSVLVESGVGASRFFVLVQPRHGIKVSVYKTLEDLVYFSNADPSLICIIDPEQTGYDQPAKLSKVFEERGFRVVTSPSADPNHLSRDDKENFQVRRFWVSPWTEAQLKCVCSVFQRARWPLMTYVVELPR